MGQHLIRILALIMLILEVLSAASSNLMAQVRLESCHQVDLDNLKLFEQDDGWWKIQDVTNDWDLNFYRPNAAKRFVEVLGAYKVKTLCQRYNRGNDRIMQYILTSSMQAPTGNELAGEKCAEFDAASLKVEWSDEQKHFILTDGKVIVLDFPWSKADLLDVVDMVKKYNLGIHCRENYAIRAGTNDDIQYWKRKPTVFKAIDSPAGPRITAEGIAVTPRTYPLVCRGSKDVTIEVTIGKTLALKFKKGSAPAGDGLAPGECSWQDRGINAAEPNQLVQEVREGAESDPEYKWSAELRDPSAYWTFDVYNDGKGHMIAVKARTSAAIKPKPEGMAEWNSLGGSVGSGPAAVRGKDRSILIFVKGTDGALWTRTFKEGKWLNEWTSLGGALTSAPAAATWDAATIVVVARGTDNAIWSRRFYNGSWEIWRSLGGDFNGGPGISSRGTERYEVFGVGTDNAIYHQSFNGYAPTEWVTRGKIIGPGGVETIGFLNAPVAISVSAKVIDVFAVGSDNQLYWKGWTESLGAWDFNWERLGGELSSSPAATMSGDGDIIIVARGVDFEVQKLIPRRPMLRTGIFNWTSLGGKLFAQPAVVNDLAGHILVFGIAADNALWWRSFPEKD